MDFRVTHDSVHRTTLLTVLTLLLYLVAMLSSILRGDDRSPMTVDTSSLAPLVLLSALVTLSVIDTLTFQLPDVITLPLAATGVLLSAGAGLSAVFERSLAAALGFALLAIAAWLYQAWRGRPGLGLGDAKLFAVAGAWLGIEALATVMVYAAGAALVSIGLVVARGGSVLPTTRIPFGPYLAFAIWLVWLYGPIL